MGEEGGRRSEDGEHGHGLGGHAETGDTKRRPSVSWDQTRWGEKTAPSPLAAERRGLKAVFESLSLRELQVLAGSQRPFGVGVE